MQAYLEGNRRINACFEHNLQLQVVNTNPHPIILINPISVIN